MMVVAILDQGVNVHLTKAPPRLIIAIYVHSAAGDLRVESVSQPEKKNYGRLYHIASDVVWRPDRIVAQLIGR